MTVKEIAFLANVSIGTVDRVLYNRGRVSAATKEKIEAIIEQYQFSPNPIARQLKRNKAYYFCVLIPRRDQDSGYWGQVLEGIFETEKEIKPLGVEIEILEFDRYNLDTFRKNAEIILRKSPDGVVFAPLLPDKTKPFIMELKEKHIPYVFFDTDIPKLEPLCVINQDFFKGGYLAGKLMKLFVKDTAKPVAILALHGVGYHVQRRRDGFLKYAREHDLTVVVRECPDINLPKKEIIAFLNENPDLAGIFVTNSMTHKVAATAAKRNNKDLVIIGYDLVPENRRLLRAGLIDAIISQRPEEQGRRTLQCLYHHFVLSHDVPPRIEIPLDIFFRENLLNVTNANKI
ncbi:MAG: LacI family DNA-binding transcriptional regulator [Spirochaetaceae bacterium]|jgi:LacI family transcriptional regulator|nr:LacI family DNA-binding transcriptional regulator [Spirochaetaceae bacterium]